MRRQHSLMEMQFSRRYLWTFCLTTSLVQGFVLVKNVQRVCFLPKTSLESSVGGGPPSNNGNDDGKSGGVWDDLFRDEESENMLRAREYFNENALPINFDDSVAPNGTAKTASDQEAVNSTSALVRSEGGPNLFGNGNPTEDMLATNPYMAVVSKISPSDLISKFTSTAHPRVQNAVRSTILSLIGGLPKMAFDTTTITTGQRLASLMFQLQMTGYMFKNAEYRLSVQQSLESVNDIMEGDSFLLEGSSDSLEETGPVPLGKKVKGKLRIRYGANPDDDDEKASKMDDTNGTRTTTEDKTEDAEDSLGMEVDAAAYMSELRSEVLQLRDELMVTRKEKEEALRKDLLVYIRTLPEQELRSLTNTISQDVLVAMKGLVNAVMSGIGEGQIGPDTVTEQSGEAMAQLCMWQLVVGYNLRTLEVREELGRKAGSTGSSSDASNDSDTSVSSDIPPGAFE